MSDDDVFLAKNLRRQLPRRRIGLSKPAPATGATEVLQKDRQEKARGNSKYAENGKENREKNDEIGIYWRTSLCEAFVT